MGSSSRSLKIAVQMNPIETINIVGDSSFALMLEAQKRGHMVAYYTPDTLSYYEGRVTASVSALELKDVQGEHFKKGNTVQTDLNEFDVVLLRQDPPFDMGYITTTHMLERLAPRTLVVNDPASVRNAPEKTYVLDFPQFMPATLITRSRENIESFRRAHGDIVMKPLYGNGGAGVFQVTKNDPNFGSLFDMFTATSSEPWVVQEFLPAVREGDKRIILIDGKFAAALNRIPAGDDIRANMARGGSGHLSELTPREREICEVLGPELKKRGLIFVGIDVIGGYLTEINVTSPTGIRAIVRQGGPDLAPLIWDAIEARLN